MKKICFWPLALAILMGACETQDEPTTPELSEAIYWTSPGEENIRRGQLSDSLMPPTVETLFDQQDGVFGPYGIVANPQTRRLYWADYANRQIVAADLNGHQPPIILYDQNDGLTGPVGLALDPNTQHIYWTEIPANTIVRGNINGQEAPTVLYDAEDGIREPYDLKIAYQQLYWVETLDRQIMVAPLDGTEAPRILYDGRHFLFRPYHIEIDRERHYLYVLENTPPGIGLGDRIARGSPDGQARLITIFAAKDGVNNAYTMSLDRQGQNIYWINQLEQGAIWRGSLNLIGPPRKLVEDIFLG
ncbi:MAG: hypothetical protein HC880_08305 [Bacteroidia bacterium]|nr:hypothetical protein [Bacteroidia bacterium]